MSIAFITPHQRPNSGGVYVIQQLASRAAALTEVHVIVAKGRPVPIEGVQMHGPKALSELALPEVDALLIPADMRVADQLYGLDPTRGVPMLLFQGYGTPGDPVVGSNLVLAPHAVCVSSWLVDEAMRFGCTATLLRLGLDRSVFEPGEPPESRPPRVAFMTHTLDWKASAEGLEAIHLAREQIDDLEVRLFGKLDPASIDDRFKDDPYLAAPNELRDVAALLRESAVFVCASWEEGLGLPGIEAITSGAALATTDTKGSRDYAFHDRTALVSPPHQPEELARNIVDLIRDPGLRERLVTAGRHQIDATFPDWERATEAFVADVHTAASNIRERRDAHAGVAGTAIAVGDGGLEAEALVARLRREARRASLLLREAEVERHELEAELGRRGDERVEARRQARELASALEREHDARELAEARVQRMETRVARGEERITELAAAAAASTSELGKVREQLQAIAQSLAERDSQLAEARTRQRRLEQAEADARREVERLAGELELASARRKEAHAELAQARADAETALAERAAYERQVSALSAAAERGPSRRRPAAPLEAAVEVDSPVALAELELLPSAATRSWSRLPPTEREAQEMFMSAYGELVELAPPSPDDRDPLALPLPFDVRGMLAAADEEQEPGTPSVDVVVCVHNALEDARRCIWSLLHRATRRFRLIVVNDGSDAATTEFLAALAAGHPAMALIERNDPPHGYTLAANAGMRVSASDYVVLLNSDTLVSHGWLERIVSYGSEHESVGILGPLTNAGSHQSIPEKRTAGEWATNPLPDWLTEDGVALILRRAAPRTETHLPFINGFCYVIKRAVIDSIGLFDEEHFPSGYAEENDYSQRARVAGFGLGVVDDAYVYHAKSRSYGSAKGKEIARAGYKVFLDKHGAEKINALVKAMEADTALNPVRAAIADALSNPAATVTAIARDVDAARLSVAFVLPGLSTGGSGGSHSIYQEVHGLRSLGVDAKIMLRAGSWDRARSAYDDAAEVFDTFDGTDELAERTADSNVIVATHFKSVAMVSQLSMDRDDFLPAYYVQDYEPMFKFADDSDNDEAAASYTAIPGALLFAKTHWLCNVVSRRHGVYVAKVEPSIDSAIYRPGSTDTDRGVVRITAMLRPRTPRRQPYSTIAVLRRVLEERPDAVEITTFGCSEDELNSVTRAGDIDAVHLGILKREQVADALRRSDVFLDMSTYQAFGRTALEAMACGCTAVVPRFGGVWEFVDEGRNALTVDTSDREAAVAALLSLVDDRARLAEMKVEAISSGARHSILRAAISEYVVLLNAYRARFG